MGNNTANTAVSTWDAANMTGGLQGNAFGNVTNTISNTGNSIIYIVMMILGFVGVVAFGITALKLMVGGSNTKSEAKGQILWVLVALIVGFGAMAIVGLVQTISMSLFT